MNLRKLISLILLALLVAGAQWLLAAPFWRDLTYSGLRFWLQPGLLVVASTLSGVLLHLALVDQNHRLKTLPFAVLSVAGVFLTFYFYICAALPFLMLILLFQADFARIVAGVFLGMLVTNQLRKPTAVSKSGDLQKRITSTEPQS